MGERAEVGPGVRVTRRYWGVRRGRGRAVPVGGTGVTAVVAITGVDVTEGVGVPAGGVIVGGIQLDNASPARMSRAREAEIFFIAWIHYSLLLANGRMRGAVKKRASRGCLEVVRGLPQGSHQVVKIGRAVIALGVNEEGGRAVDTAADAADKFFFHQAGEGMFFQIAPEILFI